jgi:hypothetical protein
MNNKDYEQWDGEVYTGNYKFDIQQSLESYGDSDVMKVYTPKNLSQTLDLESPCELIWERPSYSEMFDYIEGIVR